MHEMAHHFGFGDQYENDLLDCDHTGSIMDGRDFEDPERDFSDDDKCMYMKMYCWVPPNGVEENSEILKSIYIYPNPINDNTINIEFRNFLEISMKFDILSSNGTLITSGNIKADENLKTIILNNLTSGAYYLNLKYEGKSEIKKFIINK